MKGKGAPLIIVILLIIIIVIRMVMFSIFSTGKTENSNNTETEITIRPKLELNKEIKDNKAIITINATMEDGSNVKQIMLPDKTFIMESNTTYEVTENGDYEFVVYSENGISTSEIINISELEKKSAAKPYIPEGFSEVGGAPESGYVIEDEHGNQYVWVPVETGKLTRNTALDKEYEETNAGASSLVNSVAQNYGFYIARFETSKYEIDGKEVAATMSGKNPWTNINCQDAINYCNNSSKEFGYADCNTALISSFAWDTVLEWIDKTTINYSSSTNYGNYTGTVYPTGYTTEDNINNICDLAGNVREWTTEIYKSNSTSNKKNNETKQDIIYRVVRGGSANLSRTPQAHIGYAEDTSDAYWGFRMVLYK